MCVFDCHDGAQVVKFVKKYMEQQVFDKPKWDRVTESGTSKEMEDALVNYIQEIDNTFFKSIEPFIFERQTSIRDTKSKLLNCTMHIYLAVCINWHSKYGGQID